MVEVIIKVPIFGKWIRSDRIGLRSFTKTKVQRKVSFLHKPWRNLL